MSPTSNPTSNVNSILTALKKDSIIPDIIPPSLNFTPSMTLSVAYSNGKETRLGNELTRVDTLDEPAISFAAIAIPGASGEENAVEEPEAATYTVVMTDPDAPSRTDPKYGEVKHWIMTGVKQSADGTTTRAKHVVTPYAPPGPPPGTGLHRYIFLLFREPPSPSSLPSSPSVPIIPHGATEYGAELKDRINWNAMHFAERYGLELVGVNWFLARSLEG